MKKVLVSGAAGFIGSNMVKFLLDNSDYKIIGVDNFNSGDSNKDFISNLENKHTDRFIFIKDDYTANPHSVYDIVENKVGDCSEHALLFNTLARAVGIPSRELSGIINYEENKFAIHAWNEVVIDGYWYPVDPTWNYIVPPLTHIKFDLLEFVPATYKFKVVEIEYY